MTTLLMLIVRWLATGLLVFLTWTTPRTWVPGELVTASMMNTHVRDNFNAVKGFIPVGFTGLQLRTHPDADKAANQVALLSLDQVVMSDGVRYSDLSAVLPLTADITASGAGGLDTGTRVASTWYEIHLIGKSSTQNPADLRLLLHRAKDYLLDQSSTTAPDTSQALRSSASTTKLGQLVQVGTAALPCEVVDLELQATATPPTGNLWVEIQDNAGTVLATSDKLDASKVSTSAQWVRFAFRTPYTAFATGTNYRIALAGDYTISGTVYIKWLVKSTGGYSFSAQSFDGATWSNVATVSQIFKLYLTENDVNIATTLPTGYDESCQVGWVYNNSGNVLVPFVAKDRRVRVGQGAAGLGAIASFIPTLVDASSALPPCPVSMWFGFYGTVAGDQVDVAGVPDGFTGSAATTVVAARSYKGDSSYETPPGVATETEKQGLYLLRTGGTGTLNVEVWEWEW